MTADEMWTVLSDDKLMPGEAGVFNKLLRALEPGTCVTSAVGFQDASQNATRIVYTVAVSDKHDAIFGTVYEHPGRIVFAQFNDHLAAQVETPSAADDFNEMDRLLAEFKEATSK